ncbi:hypothetical protein CRE_17753 [Caenorhabditis remanei]|uniref:Uncharacterized protein n=1 Tax=Caenorhabditis remanei TaxID=31234 RepID=E3NS42_CAERE|nr:hypothetical protein CRE_17753 [Caenorhabditis remanei]
MSIDDRLGVLLEMELDVERTLKNNKDMLDEVTKELESLQKLFKEPGPTRILLDDVLKNIGCDSRVWFQQLTGNQARTLLRPDNIRKVLAVFPSDSSDNITFMEEVMMDLSALMSSANNQEKTDEEIDEIESLLWRIERNLRVAQPTSSVTPKLHMLTAHLIPYLRLHRSWGHLTEQGIEHLHAVVNALHLRFASVPDPVLNATLVLKHLSNFNFLFDVGQSWFQSD